MNADPNPTSSRTNGPAWVFAIAAASSLAAQSEQRIALAASAPLQSALGPVASTILINLLLGILVAVAVPWFEVVVPRRKVLVTGIAVVGASTAAAVAFDTGGHFELIPIIVLTLAATLARFLSVMGDVSYVGLLSHEERVRRYFFKYFGGGTAVLLLQGMAVFSRNLFGRGAVVRDLLGAGVALVLLAALLWRILPDFAERDSPSPRTSWRTAVLGAIDELRRLELLWPAVAVFALLPVPTEALRQAARTMLWESPGNGGLSLNSVDIGTIFGVWASFASLAGLLGGWFALRRVSPERLVRASIALSTVGVLTWWALFISRQTGLLWVTFAACLDALCQGFVGVIVLILAMKVFGSLRHYATGYVWLVALAELLYALARPLAEWSNYKLGIATTIQVFAIATVIVATMCVALWSGTRGAERRGRSDG
ncbi:MAG: hypothetical protein QM784_37285 [Polyangiaceae bacterium]